MSRVGQRALASVLALAACASPSVEERRWIEIATPHITVVTDLDEREAARFAEALEWFHQLLVYATGHEVGPAPPPAAIFLFRDGDAFLELMRGHWSQGGRFVDRLHGRYVLVDASFHEDVVYEIAFHEYAHLALHSVRGARFPIWYDEGMAMLLSQVWKDGADLVLGRGSRVGWRPKRAATSVSLGELLAMDGSNETYRDPTDNRDVHSSGWGLTHYFFLDPERRRGLDHYLRLWSEGAAPEAAFRSAVRRPVEEVEPELRDYLRQGSLPDWRIPRAGARARTARRAGSGSGRRTLAGHRPEGGDASRSRRRGAGPRARVLPCEPRARP